MKRLCVLVLVALCSACSPDDAILDDVLYRCRTTPDCGPGYACTTGTAVVGFDFCAPAPSPCDASTCDGRCTQDGTCLRGCDLHADGTTSTCPVEGTECVRYASDTRGVCFPVKSCDQTSDCASGVCLTELLSDGMGRHPSNLYCLPTPNPAAPDMECPAGYVFIAFLGDGGYCVPACSADGECPPSFGCFSVARVFNFPVDPCFPGIIGTACTDDTNCLYGECLQFNDSGAKACTTRCSDIERTPGADCSSLDSADFLRQYRTWTCNRARDVCAPAYAPGFPCNAAYPCEAGLECRPIDFGMGPRDVCTTTCTRDTDCGDRGACFGTAPTARCLGRQPVGEACVRDRQCEPTLTCPAGTCT